VAPELTELKARFDALEAAQKTEDEPRKSAPKSQGAVREQNRKDALDLFSKKLTAIKTAGPLQQRSRDVALDAAKVAAEKARALGRAITEPN